MRGATLFGAAMLPVLVGASTMQAQPAELLYVCIQDDAKIAVVDMNAGSVVRTIDLTTMGFSATAKPHHAVGEPDGSFWYVSLIGENRVIKLDPNDQVVGQIPLETPGLLALDAVGGRLVVSRSMSAVSPPNRIGLARTSPFEVEEIDVFFPRPHPMVLGRGFAYTGSLGVNQLAALGLEDERVVLTDIEGPPQTLVQFAISPDGGTLVATGEVSGDLLVFNLSEPASPRLVKTVELGSRPFHPVFTPDGRSVWVPVKGANEIAILETYGWTVTDRIRNEAFRQPHQVVFSADGATAFLSNNAKTDMAMMGGGNMDHAMEPQGTGALVILDVASKQVTKSIPLGKNLTGMGTRARR